jgi:hypothetical protein
VLRLQASGSPSFHSVDIAAELFIDTHLRNDPDLLPENTDSYRFLIRHASESIIQIFFGKVHGMVGMAERKRENRDDIDEDEAAILSEALTRSMRGLSEQRLSQLRDSFPRTGSPKNTIWFAAMAPIAKMKVISFRETREINYYAILSALIERSQSGDLAPATAAALLYIATNESFLQVASIRNAVEQANLHLLDKDTDRLKDPFVNQLLSVVAAGAAKGIEWVGKLETEAIPIDEAPFR